MYPSNQKVSRVLKVSALVATLSAFSSCRDPVDPSPQTCGQPGAWSTVYQDGINKAKFENEQEYQRGFKIGNEGLTEADGIRDGKNAAYNTGYNSPAGYKAGYDAQYGISYNAAYNTAANYQSGYSQGRANGIADGNSKGSAKGQEVSYNVASNEADKYAKYDADQLAAVDGYNYGTSKGYDAANYNGTSQGNSQGATDGYDDGYYDGYYEGDAYCSAYSGLRIAAKDADKGARKPSDEEILLGACQSVGYNANIDLKGNYNKGYAEGKALNTTYKKGYDAWAGDAGTIEQGRIAGYDAGKVVGGNDGAKAGAQARYNEGYTVGYTEVYEQTYNAAYTNTYHKNYDANYRAAYKSLFNSYYTSYYNYYYDYYYSYTYNAYLQSFYNAAYYSSYDTYYETGYETGYYDALDDCGLYYNGLKIGEKLVLTSPNGRIGISASGTRPNVEPKGFRGLRIAVKSVKEDVKAVSAQYGTASLLSISPYKLPAKIGSAAVLPAGKPNLSENEKGLALSPGVKKNYAKATNASPAPSAAEAKKAAAVLHSQRENRVVSADDASSLTQLLLSKREKSARLNWNNKVGTKIRVGTPDYSRKTGEGFLRTYLRGYGLNDKKDQRPYPFYWSKKVSNELPALPAFQK